jgi:hypothetical protein
LEPAPESQIGFNTCLAYYPADKLTVVALGNFTGDAPQRIGNDNRYLGKRDSYVPRPHPNSGKALISPSVSRHIRARMSDEIASAGASSA